MGKSKQWIFVTLGALLTIGAHFLPWVATSSLAGASQHSAIEMIKTSFLEGGALIYSGIAILLGAVMMAVILILGLTSMRTCEKPNCPKVPVIVLSLLSAVGMFAGLFLMKGYYAKINALQEVNYQIGPALGYYLSFAGIAIILLGMLTGSSKRAS